MKPKKVEKYLLLSIIIIACIFIISYITYPFFISVEQANKWNIQKFDRKKTFLESVIRECQQIYEKKYQNQYNVEFDNSMLPDSIRSKLERNGMSLDLTISKEKDSVRTYARFIIYRHWNIRVLNNVILYYKSYRKFDKCNRNDHNLRARMDEYCLGDGWFFEVDTDWL